MINIYTDGACSGNPGIGGWGVVILFNNKEILLNGGDQHTTNNKMELTAAIKALEYFEIKKELIIYTDSKYVKDGIESVSYTHLRAHETDSYLVCRLLLEKKK